MDLSISDNSATITLSKAQNFFVKPALLKGFRDYDWTLPPPHFTGSPIQRLYHRVYIMKEVATGANQDLKVKIIGNYPRGQFKSIKLETGEKYCIGIRYLAGFSDGLRSIHTRIRFSPAYWLLHEYFFSVFEGPGTVLLYSPSGFEESNRTEFQTARLAAFQAGKKFKPVSPRPKKMFSQLINLLFSHEVIWQFEQPGFVIAETINPDPSGKNGNFLKVALKHLLGFLRL